jgi:PAS domain-containing protein
MPALPPPPADQLVTSSDLVRHFGLWQERAARAPLYILHRGRPRFVLTSIEMMEALCAPHTLGEVALPRTIDTTALLDAISDIVLLADGDGVILATSHAARAHFGAIASIGAPIDAIAPASARTALSEAIRRGIAWGIGDRLEIPSAARETRMLRVTIEPAGPGIVVVAQDGTTERNHASASATQHALGVAMQAAAGIASATINLRGYIVDPTPALATLTGMDCAALAQLRFVALAENDQRVALERAIEHAMAGETPAALECALRIDPAGPSPVQIGLAPIRSGNTVTGVVAILVAR